MVLFPPLLSIDGKVELERRWVKIWEVSARVPLDPIGRVEDHLRLLIQGHVGR